MKPSDDRDDHLPTDLVQLAATVTGATTSALLAGPAGAVVGAAAGEVTSTALAMTLRPMIDRMQRRRQSNAEEMLALAIEASEVSLEDFIGRVEHDLTNERLTSAAIEAAAETSYDEKLGAIARSLARGLTADGRPDVDEQLLVIDALRAMEPAHVWLLDRVVQWQPLTGSIISGVEPPYGEAISVVPKERSRLRWITPVRWTMDELRAGFVRHKTPASFDPVFGTLVHRGILRTGDHIADFPAKETDTPDQIVKATDFGLRLHALLAESEALEILDEGELDISASDAWAERGIPGWAKLEKYADILGMSKTDARQMAESAAERLESSGFAIVSNRPPGETGILARVVRPR